MQLSEEIKPVPKLCPWISGTLSSLRSIDLFMKKVLGLFLHGSRQGNVKQLEIWIKQKTFPTPAWLDDYLIRAVQRPHNKDVNIRWTKGLRIVEQPKYSRVISLSSWNASKDLGNDNICSFFSLLSHSMRQLTWIFVKSLADQNRFWICDIPLSH